MPKRSKDPIEKARRELAEAQLEFHFAQEHRGMAIAQGEREIREAQERAARRTRKATERLEKRAGAVARAEAKLYTLTDRIGRLRAEQAAKKDAKRTPVSAPADAPGSIEPDSWDGQ